MRLPPRSYSLTAVRKKSRRGWKVLAVEQWVESTLQKLSSPHDTLWHDLRSQRECVFCAVHFQAPAKSFSSLLWGNRFGHGEMRVTQNGNLYSQIYNLSLFHSLVVASTNAGRNSAKNNTVQQMDGVCGDLFPLPSSEPPLPMIFLFIFLFLFLHTWITEITQTHTQASSHTVSFMTCLKISARPYSLLWKITLLHNYFKNVVINPWEKGVPHVLLFTYEVGRAIRVGFLKLIAVTWLWVIRWLYPRISYSGHVSRASPLGWEILMS